MTRVLVVEDDPWIQWMMADDLADRGHEVITAYDGVEALDRISEAQPDVIVLDLTLPRSDGWELTRTTRWSRAARSFRSWSSRQRALPI